MLTDEVRKHMSELGKKGQKIRKQRYTTEDFKRWGKMGGRPSLNKKEKKEEEDEQPS